MTDDAIAARQRANLDHLADVEVELVTELGRTTLPLKRARNLVEGDVISIEMHHAGHPYALRINDLPFAEGDIDVQEEQLMLRVTRLRQAE